jgi:hypothetical protein
MPTIISNIQMKNLSDAVEWKIESVLSTPDFVKTERTLEELRKKNYDAQCNADDILPKFMHLRDCLVWLGNSYEYTERYSETVSEYLRLQLEFAETESLYLTSLRDHSHALSAYADKCGEFHKMKVLRKKLDSIRHAEYELMIVVPTISTITDYDDLLVKARENIREMWKELGESRDYEIDDVRSPYEEAVHALAERYNLTFEEMLLLERKQRVEFDTYHGIVV